MLACISQFLQGIDHHDELLKCVNAKGKIFLGDVQTLEILAHIIHDLFTLLGLLLDDADFTNDLLRELLGLLDLLADLDVHHGMFMDLIDQLLVHLSQLSI